MSRIIRHVKGLTAQEDKFCQEIVKHGKQSRAFRIAFPDSTDNSNRGSARLMHREDIKKRIKELAAGIARDGVLEVEYLAKELQRNIEGARELGDFGASNKAIELAMRYRGMIGEKVEKENETGKININLFSSGDRTKDIARLASAAGYTKLIQVNNDDGS